MTSARHAVAAAFVVALSLVLFTPGVARADLRRVVLRPRLTLPRQFGYSPECTQNVPTFASRNAPDIRSRSTSQNDTSFIHRLEKGRWVGHDFLQALRSAYPDATTDADGRSRQTYLSLVCGPDDVIHVVSRQLRLNTGLYSRGSTYFVLVHQKLRRGRQWSAPTLVVVPPRAGCAISSREPRVPPEERCFHHRMVLISEDGGARWRFATTADFAAGMEPYAAEAQPHTAAGEQAGAGDTPAA